jgi:lysophospholipase L1-like esterase
MPRPAPRFSLARARVSRARVSRARVPTARVSMAAVSMAASVAAALSLMVSPASAQSAVNYVALGDSYAAGVGAGQTISSSRSCDRSSGAYSALWAAANDPASFVFASCSGATVRAVLRKQLSALSGSTTLVSLTVGGDNAGFTKVLETCTISSTSTCVKAVNKAETKVTDALPAALNSLLSAIKADAPNATVVILGYPDFYDLSQSSSCSAVDGLSTTDRTDVDQGIDLIDGVLQTAAARNGDVFADVRPAFAGHEICDSDSWLNAIDLADITSSYHPTAAGQADGYLPLLTAAAGVRAGRRDVRIPRSGRSARGSRG